MNTYMIITFLFSCARATNIPLYFYNQVFIIEDDATTPDYEKIAADFNIEDTNEDHSHLDEYTTPDNDEIAEVINTQDINTNDESTSLDDKISTIFKLQENTKILFSAEVFSSFPVQISIFITLLVILAVLVIIYNKVIKSQEIGNDESSDNMTISEIVSNTSSDLIFSVDVDRSANDHHTEPVYENIAYLNSQENLLAFNK